MKEEIVSDKDFSIWRVPVGQMQANCYILIDKPSSETMIIDPGDDAQYIIETITSLNVTPKMIIATHGHFDHIMAAFEVAKTFSIPFSMNAADQFLLDRMSETAEHFLGIQVVEPAPTCDKDIKDGMVVTIGKSKIKVYHTPGHTPGSVCLAVVGKNILFTGDTIFAEGGVGRTDFSYSDQDALKQSLVRILSFPGDMILLPGHEDSTTVAKEKECHS